MHVATLPIPVFIVYVIIRKSIIGTDKEFAFKLILHRQIKYQIFSGEGIYFPAHFIEIKRNAKRVNS